MAKNNQLGKTTDEETGPDPEIWAAIRDLDPDRRENEMECTPKVRHEFKGPITLNGGEQCLCPDNNIPAN
jgi:hypothetical protein